MQLALAISQSEAEEKENQKKKSTTKLLNTSTPASSTGPPTASIAAPPEDLDPELVRYLDFSTLHLALSQIVEYVIFANENL